MKVTVLDPVEPLTPVEVCRQTGVPMDWLQRMLDRNKISHVKSSYLRLINSSDLDEIRAMYDEYVSRRKKK
ncbi:helix-turn-helix domain-containing protein [Rhodocaloribacter litoris]|uniref:excisionase family DNA-binding protein n=1 Tax=Rhodocaloribacter litoris TaxID=2558931 RepID=UPI001421050B|nr:excisionase family DNA-binding protein [Rhodocaloribacter litoris]QXD14883.1 helix-turn-helix domain-containing protein [Rhodocaloribacter litoris]GIV59019.1 MAG: hypothetical protein KatS3mg043_0108 [Rhodothermaceae bacterium]